MNYYERHLGDYARDAGHLTMLEHGAYTLLLDRYYTTEQGIPADQVHRFCRARTREEKEAVDTVLAEFFTLTGDCWVNGRASREVTKMQAKVKAAQENGKRGGRPRRTEQEPDGNPPGSESVTQIKAHQSPVTSHHISDPDGSGVPPPILRSVEPKALTPKDRVWLLGPPLLGDTPTTRSLLGKLAKTYTDEVLARVLAEATADRPIEPKAWIVAACEAAPKTNGHAQPDMLADPTPDWATRAGFDSRFLAENAGCGPGNAHKFRDGRRTAA